jgi:hypothetical protein
VRKRYEIEEAGIDGSDKKLVRTRNCYQIRLCPHCNVKSAVRTQCARDGQVLMVDQDESVADK